MANLNIGRDGIALCPIGNLLFAVGGYSGSAYLSLVECYDPVNNEWREVRNFLSVVVSLDVAEAKSFWDPYL